MGTMEQVSLLRCLIGLDDGHVISGAGIHYKEGLWIVVGWTTHQNTPRAIVKRIIRVDARPMKRPDGPYDYQSVLLPISLDAIDKRVAMPSTVQYEDLQPTLYVDKHQLFSAMNQFQSPAAKWYPPIIEIEGVRYDGPIEHPS